MSREALAQRMSKAFKALGFFIFEAEELSSVKEVLEEAKLHETLRVVKLGDVDLRLKNLNFETSYYMVTLDLESCLGSCKDDECLKACAEEKKEAVARALSEVKGQRPRDLSSLLKRLQEDAGRQ